MSELVKGIIREWREAGVPDVFPRDLDLGDVPTPQRGNLVRTIVGVRRCGKTYRLFQEMRRILDSGVSADRLLYFNFEDERLKPFGSGLLQDVLDSYFELYPHARAEGVYLFFDEIQEVPDWGMFLRRLVDTLSATIYVTGSSSKMLSREVATEFRGRALPRELFPMSFSEYMRFHGKDVGLVPADDNGCRAFTSDEVAHLRHGLDDYLERGGFIAVQNLSAPDSVALLQEYANRTLSNDVIDRYDVRNPVAASAFLSQAIAASGRELSINKTANLLTSRGLRVSRGSLASLLDYYEEAYLLFSVREFSRALADNSRSVSKVYAVDQGMFSAFSRAAAQERGQRLETAVFLKLRRDTGIARSGTISRLLFQEGSNRHEIDFVVGDALMLDAYQLIQVCLNMDDDKTRRREVGALQAAMRRFSLKTGTVVTLDREETITVPEGTIGVVPAWKWLLNGGVA
ncbi:ATP-binding protein [Bifidobacterium amazonense]|uniref:ATP-binding protein n=1 Tax=Bifidobacterium amazonense TaxID=2809027 RepID=A0ABS9VY20_9BIFI|nr:ATP-binding protein [Bifidobacterium amazonense]MCH9277002.1 ATP-binding protein [Bifidobacterium amazonense]